MNELSHFYQQMTHYNGEENINYRGGYLFIGLIEVGGFKGAFHGMRNPMNSWRLEDTVVNHGTVVVGKNDLNLAQRLINGGPEHRKFLRQINVTFDMNMPRYVWSEFDTYHYNTKNSTSTMHKLFNTDDTKEAWVETVLDKILSTRGELNLRNFFYHEEDEDILKTVIVRLEDLREKYFNCKPEEKLHILRRAKQILPESWLQMRTVTTNYEELRNIYFQRKNHRLNIEWGLFCRFVESLPYAQELILYVKEK